MRLDKREESSLFRKKNYACCLVGLKRGIILDFLENRQKETLITYFKLRIAPLLEMYNIRIMTVKYDNGSSIFPVFSSMDKDTMRQDFGLDVPLDTLLNWKHALEHFST